MPENELGTFLRARRERLSPAEFGLPMGARRRTPGLRRAELATLAGVSVEYLARLEQGRDRNPSPQVITALADALRLPNGDRVQLVRIVKAATGASCIIANAPAGTVRPAVRMLLERLEPTPAVVVNRLTDVIGHTSGFGRLMRPLGLFDAATPNLARFIFADPRARLAYPEWERVADGCIANLRLGSASSDSYLARLVEDLRRGADSYFTNRACAGSPIPRGTGVERLAHPHAGELRLAFETLALSDIDEQRLIAYLPDDDETAAALDRLVRPGPASLRAVNG